MNEEISRIDINNVNYKLKDEGTRVLGEMGKQALIKVGYYVCSTQASIAEKTISAADYTLSTGGGIKVKMDNANTANNATLNINSTGAKPLFYAGERASANNSWGAGETVEVYYDGTNFYANNVVGGGKFATGEKVSEVGIDDEPTAGSDNMVKSGGVQNELALGAVYDVSAKNPTAGPNNDGKFESLSALLSDTNLNTLIPIAYRKGGMSIKFVQSSENKYVQYRLATQYFSTNEDDWTEGGGDDGIYDISKKTGGTTYIDLTNALGTDGANVPTSVRKGGMSVKFIKAIPATYNVIKTENVEEAPSGGTLLESAPYIESGIYIASQLSAFDPIPESTSADAIVYYVAVTVDETTTYTTWSITMVSANAQEYEQWRYMGTSTANADFVKVADWQGVDKKIVKNSRNIITSGAIANLTDNYLGEPYLRIGVKMNDNYFIRGDGSLQQLTGYAVSDLIDISNYKDRELILIHGCYGRDPRACYFYDDNGVAISGSGVNYAPSYIKLSIPSNAKYIRISSFSNNISSILLYTTNIEPRYSYQEISNNIKVCLDTFHKIGIKTENIWGVDEEQHCFIQSAEGSSLPYNRFIKLEPHFYTKIKTGVRANSSKDLVFYHNEPEMGNLVVPFHTETFVNNTNTDAVIEKNVLLDFSNEECLTVHGEIISEPALNPAYAGKITYKGTISGIITKNDYETAVSTGKYYLGISMDYITDDENTFFKGKKYVAYGDSITVSAGNSLSSPYIYPRLIGKHFKLELINRGASGSRPIVSSNLSDDNLAYVDEDTMLVTISGGENGWATAEDINSTDRSTSIGAINYYIDQIRTIQPKCLIVLCPTYIAEGNSQCAIDYARIAENKHVGIAPTLNLNLIDWEYDKTPKVLRYDNVHLTEYGASRFAAVCIKYIENMIL